MGVCHKVTEDSFSQDWGTRLPARCHFNPQEISLHITHAFSQSQACVWYDWFLSDSDPDPTVVAHFEELFLEVRGHSINYVPED